MSYRIIEIDGVSVNPTTKRFPVEVYPEVHEISGQLHTGILLDSQIPQNIMRDNEHQNNPHTMIIDGRDVSVDGAKLDTIENGAEVNNLTDIQASSLVSGAHSSWHHHDSFYYRKTNLQTQGEASIHWLNLTNIPETFPPAGHDHNSLYYTKTDLDDGVLDSRYYTEGEVDDGFYSKIELDSGQLDSRYYTETEINNILTGYYTKTQLNNGQLDNRYYTETEVDGLLSSKSDNGHIHDGRYYTENELSPFANLGDNVLDERYYTETEIQTNHYTKVEIDGLISSASYGISGSVDYFTELPTPVDSGIIYIVKNSDGGNEEGFYRWDGSAWSWLAHNVGGVYHNDLLGVNNGDYLHLTSNEYSQLTNGGDTTLHTHHTLYYTEGEVDNLLSGKSNKTHLHDDRYYTENEINTLFTNYYTKVQLSPSANLGDNVLDSRYYTEGEVDSLFYTRTELDSGQLDSRYYTETEVDGMLANYYTQTQLDPSTTLGSNVLDERYYTEGEIDSTLNLYFTKNQLLNGSIDSRYYTEAELDGGALDSRYYTEGEVDNLLSAKSDTTHLHDERYYTEDEVDTLLSGKSDVGHNHNDQYYTQTQLSTSSVAEVHWANLTNVPSEFTPSSHTHNDLYYTETELDGGALDSRYYTETELDAMIASAAYGISGSVDLQANLPGTAETGEIYIVSSETDPDNEGFYRWDGVAWMFLAPNTGMTEHNNMNGLNSGDYIHLTQSEYTSLTAGLNTSLHHHNDAYYTEGEIDNLLSGKSDISHIHDERYYTESEIDVKFANYYTQSQLTGGQLDSRYYTEDEIDSNFYTQSQLNNGQLDNRYYTETEIDGLLLNKSDVGHIHDGRYYTETEIDGLLGEKSDTDHIHDGRYYTETETNNLLSNKSDITHVHDTRYYTQTQLSPAANIGDNILDSRYYTEGEIDSLFYTKTELDLGQLDNRYYTINDINAFMSNYYTASQLNNGQLDSRYFTETEIQDNYYTKTQLNLGQLDSRYYTEGEVDTLLAAIQTFGIKGGVDYYSDLPGGEEGEIYIVRYSDGTNSEGFYRHDGTEWIWLAANVGITHHNNLDGLNSGDYLHLSSSEYASLTSGGNTTLHSHDSIYYTETEVDGLLLNKSDVGHNHNSIYYTETEIDGLLLNKSDVGHNHDGRYYTQSHIQNTYYTKADLDSGQLNGQYYTESEIDGLLNGKSDTGHIHDDRYYTESEIDGLLNGKSDTTHTHNELYYTETEVDGLLVNKSDTGHIHDDRYYTESELSSPSGSGLIGASILGLSSTTVEGALGELKNEISLSSSNLQEAYENGNTILTDDTHGPVKLDGGTTPGLELTNQLSVPTQNVNSGAISIINNTLYIFDGPRNKWLTQSKILAFGRHISDGHMLSQANVWDWEAGYKMVRQGCIIGFSLFNTRQVSGKDVYILINGTTAHTLATNSNGEILVDNLNIDFNQGDKISVYIGSSGQGLKDVVVTLEFSWRA